MKAFHATVLLLCATLAGCGGGPVRRVSEPAASIQQLTVRADGSWSVDLRINNFSSVPMRFDNVSLAVAVGGESAGTLQGQPAISIGPESADVATLALSPTSAARIAVADALSSRKSLAYTLKGSVDATPEEGKSRSFEIERSSALNPVPGLPGVMR
ncbi:MAG TPA: LEA type 2 family protein [Lysobacter sp.]|nr:LEA type 2 family protein [Lysobacter sp.]